MSSLQADFDQHGSVDFADFLVLSRNFGDSASPSEGYLEFADFLQFSRQFGQTDDTQLVSINGEESLVVAGEWLVRSTDAAGVADCQPPSQVSELTSRSRQHLGLGFAVDVDISGATESG